MGDDCYSSVLQKQIQCSGIKCLNTSNLVPNVSQSQRQRQRKTFKEFRLEPVAVNPRVMACSCDLMAVHFLQWWSGESLPHPTTSTDTSLTLLSSHLCMLCAGCQPENNRVVPVAVAGADTISRLISKSNSVIVFFIE